MTSDNNMLFAGGLLDRGVLTDLNPEVSEKFLKDIDIESLFEVADDSDLQIREELDSAVDGVRAALHKLNYGIVRAARARAGKK